MTRFFNLLPSLLLAGIGFLLLLIVFMLATAPEAEAGPVAADLYSQYHRMGEVTIDVPAGTEAGWCYLNKVNVQQQDNGKWLTGTEIWCKLYNADKVWWELQYRNFPEENTI